MIGLHKVGHNIAIKKNMVLETWLLACKGVQDIVEKLVLKRKSV